MSVDAISTLERRVRRRPHNYTVAQLANALDLADEERAVIAATARRPPATSQAAIHLVDTAAAIYGYAAVPATAQALPHHVVTFFLGDAEGSMHLPRRLRGRHGWPSSAD
jgi:hypothetical protein